MPHLKEVFWGHRTTVTFWGHVTAVMFWGHVTAVMFWGHITTVMFFQMVFLFETSKITHSKISFCVYEIFYISCVIHIVWLFSVKNDCVNTVLPILMRYKSTKDSGSLFCISFTTLTEYLWLLRAACECLAPFGSRAMLYLAAAVSDFYIPSNKMVSMQFESKLCSVVNSMLSLNVTNQLTNQPTTQLGDWTTDVLTNWKSFWEKVIVPWLVEKFSVFYVTQMFITLCTKYVTLFQILIPIDPVHTLPSYFIKMHCNIVLPPMHRSCKWSPSFLHASPQKPLKYFCSSVYLPHFSPISSSLMWWSY